MKITHRKIIYTLTALLSVFIIFAIFFNINSNINTSAATPDGFDKSVVIAEGLNLPTKFVETPDGRIFITEKNGSLRVWENNVLMPESVIDIPVENEGDRGLLGIVLDPNFAENSLLYLHYTNPQSYVEIAKVEIDRNNIASDPIVIYRSVGTSERTHSGGGMAFGADGKLYFSIGDGLHRPNAQDLSNSFGKIIRINTDGSIPVDNPYVNTHGVLAEIWAFGLRNPFSMRYDSVNNLMLVADVGENNYEEINVVKKAANYGWPQAEGDCGACAYENPLFAYPHNGQTASISLGTIYSGNQFPVAYKNSLFFADYARGFINRVELDIHDHGDDHDPIVENVFDFEPDAGTVVDLNEANDGSLYYLTIFPGQLVKIEYNPENPAPEVNISSDIETGEAPLIVNFSSQGTFDANGDELSYLWNFGDGTTSTDPNPIKTFNQVGRYRVQLIVGDGNQSTTSESIYIQVGTPPKIDIEYPIEGQTYKAGDVINYSASATDSNNNLINQENIDTSIIFHHLTHIHPFEGPHVGVSNGQFIVPVKGETHPVQWYEIVFEVEDQNGLISKRSVNVYGETSQLTVNTTPVDLTMYIDSQPYIQTFSKELLSGSEIDISTIATQEHNNNYYQFQNWSNNQEIAQSIILPANGLNLTANFKQTESFIAEYFNNQNLEGQPTFTEEVIEIDYDWGMGSPNENINVDQFSARYSKNEFFTEGEYTFTTVSDDGIRVLIDETVIIDEWHDQSSELHESTIYLAEGDHNIVVEYYENGWFASVDFKYQKSATTPQDFYNAEFYNNMNLEGQPVLTREDDVIDFDWGQASPAAEVNEDQYSARWVKLHNFENATYEFTTTSDDGIRLYIDDVLIIDQWNDHGATVHKAQIELTAGQHEIKLEYYENGWDALAKLYFDKVGNVEPTLDKYIAEYFNNKNLFGQPVLVREEDVINHDLGFGSPAVEVNPNNYSARFTKLEIFDQGNYTFTVTSDDGVRLYIDNIIVLDNWNDHGRTVDIVNLDLEAGEHEIKLEYYENGWDSVVILEEN